MAREAERALVSGLNSEESPWSVRGSQDIAEVVEESLNRPGGELRRSWRNQVAGKGGFYDAVA